MSLKLPRLPYNGDHVWAINMPRFCECACMRESLSPVQEAILAFFEEHQIRAKPATISANLDYSKNYVTRQCKHLARMGYLDSEPGPIYSLSERGRAYLAGDLDGGE